jgi:putative ubiquitin-RnfH superfamily antitoxin RatB of RatAB toxin-antitoxin module
MPFPVVVVYSPKSREVREVALVVEQGATVGDAIQSSALLEGLTPAAVHALECGVWGRKVPVDHLLQADDRVELYRPLTVDPKVARRERFVRQGAKKAAGLFAKRRAGAKAGY